MRYLFRPKVPMIFQYADTECGVAALAMVLGYHGTSISFEYLRKHCGVSRDGCKADTLIEVAHSLGYEAAAYTTSIEGLKQFTIPLIAYWNFRHYIVITQMKQDSVIIHDPGLGRVQLSLEEFSLAFTGVIIHIKPGSHPFLQKMSASIGLYFIQYFHRYRQELAWMCLSLSLLFILSYADSNLLRLFIDSDVFQNAEALMTGFSLLLFISIIYLSIQGIHQKAECKLKIKASFEKSKAVLKHIFELPMGFYHLRSKAEFVSLVQRIDSVCETLFKNSLEMLMGLLIGLFTLALMYRIHPGLTAIVLCLSIFSGVVFQMMTRSQTILEKQQLQAAGKCQTQMLAAIQNIESIKACGQESTIQNQWAHGFLKKMQIEGAIQRADILAHVWMQASQSLLSLSCLCLGSYEVMKGRLSVGALASFFSISLLFNHYASTSLDAGLGLLRIHAILARIQDWSSQKKDQRFQAQSRGGKYRGSPAIQIQKLSFQYHPKAKPCLSDIDILIHENEQIAFVGESGSGKSTLAKLIAGFYQANQGEIKIFGKKIEAYSAKEFAEALAYVPQNALLFSGSLIDHLAPYQSDYHFEAIEPILELTQIKSLVKEKGLHTILDPSSSCLSGGEMQRIEIARALIQNTSICILDEASSALDEVSEAKIMQALQKLPKTMIYIAHRLSSIRHCHQIYVLKEGRIVESGNHESLMKRQAAYYQLYLAENQQSL